MRRIRYGGQPFARSQIEMAPATKRALKAAASAAGLCLKGFLLRLAMRDGVDVQDSLDRISTTAGQRSEQSRRLHASMRQTPEKYAARARKIQETIKKRRAAQSQRRTKRNPRGGVLRAPDASRAQLDPREVHDGADTH